MTHDLISMPYPHVAEYLKKSDLLFIPFGTIEAHGRHLPLGTDTLIARDIAADMARRFGALAAPPLEYGITNSLFRYPAGSYLPPEVYTQFVRGIMSSFASHGFKRQILINGHGGNTSILNNLVAEFGKTAGHRAAALHWWITVEKVTEEHFGGAGGHAAADETSFIVALDESLVVRELYSPESHFTMPGGLSAHPAPGTVLYYGKEGPPPQFDRKKAIAWRDDVLDYLGDVFDRLFAGWAELDRIETA